MTTNIQNETPVKTTIYVWSALGHTPLTNRAGSYYDELAKVEVMTSNPAEARAKTLELIKSTPHGNNGYFTMPEYWNQNTRSAWVA